MALNTYRGNITLPTAVSREILQKTQEQSAIMRLARKITLPGTGVTIPVITGDPQAAWVDETDKKPTSNPTLSTKIMQAYKLAVIVPFSMEFRRDMGALYDALVSRLPASLGQKFDETVFGPASGKPGSNFDTLGGCTAQNLSGTGGAYDALVAAKVAISTAGYLMNGVALSPQGEGVLLGAKDTTGRPIFVASVHEGATGRLLGAETYLTKGAYKAANPTGYNTVGVAGDWTQALFGTVEGVKISISDQASLTISNAQVNLWERNMFAVRAEMEVGFRAEASAFNLLTVPVPTQAGGDSGGGTGG